MLSDLYSPLGMSAGGRKSKHNSAVRVPFSQTGVLFDHQMKNRLLDRRTRRMTPAFPVVIAMIKIASEVKLRRDFWKKLYPLLIHSAIRPSGKRRIVKIIAGHLLAVFLLSGGSGGGGTVSAGNTRASALHSVPPSSTMFVSDVIRPFR